MSAKKNTAAIAMLGSSEETNGSTLPNGTPLSTARMIDAPAIESTYWAALNHTRAAGLRAWMSAATLATASTVQAARAPPSSRHRERERGRQRQLSLGAAAEDADAHELAERAPAPRGDRETSKRATSVSPSSRINSPSADTLASETTTYVTATRGD